MSYFFKIQFFLFVKIWKKLSYLVAAVPPNRYYTRRKIFREKSYDFHVSPIYITTTIAIVYATSWETFNVMVVRVDLYVTLLLQTFGANKDISPNNESVFCEVDLSQCAKKLKNTGRNPLQLGMFQNTYCLWDKYCYFHFHKLDLFIDFSPHCYTCNTCFHWH